MASYNDAGDIFSSGGQGQYDNEFIVSSSYMAQHNRDAVAPWWHTAIVMAWLAAMSAISHYQHGLPNVHLPGLSRQLSSYITVTGAEWSLIVFIWLALRQRGLRLCSLVGGRWDSAKSLFKDIGLAGGVPRHSSRSSFMARGSLRPAQQANRH